MNEYCMAQRLMVEVTGWRVLGRQRLGWMDGNRGMTVKAAGQYRKIGMTLVIWCIQIIKFDAVILFFFLFFITFDPALWWLIAWRGVECRYMMRLGSRVKVKSWMARSPTEENRISSIINYLQSPNGELLIAVDHDKLRTIASVKRAQILISRCMQVPVYMG